MTDYIKREDAVRRIAVLMASEAESDGCEDQPMDNYIEYASEDLADIPSADVAPVRHGRWVKHGTRDRMTCSCCGDYWEMGLEWTSDNFKGWFKFCPNCGAKMDREETNE